MNNDDFSKSFLICIYVCIFVLFLIGLGLFCVAKEEEVVNNNEVKIEENINAEIENIQKEEVGKELQEIEKELQEKDTNLEQQEIVEQNKEENMMTLSEGHNELDSILADLGNVIVDIKDKDKFNRCLINLNYDNIITLGSDKLNNTINELYSIMRTPSNTMEYDKLINRFNNFTEKCPNFYEDDKLNHKYELINNIILKKLQEKEKNLEQNKEENMMTLSEGHSELDSILADLGNVIVDVEDKDKFNRCLINLNYDNIVTLGSDKVDNTINELYSIIRIPSNTTEYDKLINRLDNFTKNCPNFYEDDKLNHKYELINNIILKELR